MVERWRILSKFEMNFNHWWVLHFFRTWLLTDICVHLRLSTLIRFKVNPIIIYSSQIGELTLTHLPSSVASFGLRAVLCI